MALPTSPLKRPPAGERHRRLAMQSDEPRDAVGRRERDRMRVHVARTAGRRWQLAWLLCGPGLLVMLGENDGPSMISYAASGAAYGLGLFLPLVLATFAIAIVCQEMCMRVAAVTRRGYGELILARFGSAWGRLAATGLVVSNVATLVAELVAIRVGLAYFNLGSWSAGALGIALAWLPASAGRYWRWERVVLGLASFNALFIAAAVAAKPHWGSIASAFTSLSPLATGDSNTLLLLLAATVGAGVAPWMIFFQQAASTEKGLTRGDIGHGRRETILGGALAAVIGCAALVTGAMLAGHGGAGIQGLAGAGFPGALRRVAGPAVATLFALGLIEAGAVAILTISASTGYAACECIGVAHSFNNRPRDAPLFYLSNFLTTAGAAAIVLIPGMPLLAIALNANVLAALLFPAALLSLIVLADDPRLMGRWRNGRWTSLGAKATAALMALLGLAYGADALARTLEGLIS